MRTVFLVEALKGPSNAAGLSLGAYTSSRSRLLPTTSTSNLKIELGGCFGLRLRSTQDASGPLVFSNSLLCVQFEM